MGGPGLGMATLGRSDSTPAVPEVKSPKSGGTLKSLSFPMKGQTRVRGQSMGSLLD